MKCRRQVKLKAKGVISAVFEFSETGGLKAIYLNAENDQDQIVLEKGLSRLLKPEYFGWLKRLFRK